MSLQLAKNLVGKNPYNPPPIDIQKIDYSHFGEHTIDSYIYYVGIPSQSSSSTFTFIL